MLNSCKPSICIFASLHPRAPSQILLHREALSYPAPMHRPVLRIEILVGPGLPCIYTTAITSPPAAFVDSPSLCRPCPCQHVSSMVPTVKASLVDHQLRSPYENAIHIQGCCLPHVCLFTFTSQPHSHGAWDYKRKSLSYRPVSIHLL